MTDLSLIKQEEQQTKRPYGRFPQGVSGNPAGRPRGCRDKANRAAEILLDGEAETLARKAVALALHGDLAALRLCLDRAVAPRRERPVQFRMPPIRGAADLAGAMGAVAAAVGQGVLTPGEAVQFAQMVKALVRAIETIDFDRRLTKLEVREPNPARSRR